MNDWYAMSDSLKNIIILFLVLMVSSCTSTHNLESDDLNLGGGGYSVNEVRPGEYWVVVKTKWAPWENFGVARNMWEKRAKEACAQKGFIGKDINEYSYDVYTPYLGVIRYIITVKEGYAVCTPNE
jgi:hypothetical protein